MPKLSDSAKILYIIYGVMTLIEFAALMLCGVVISLPFKRLSARMNIETN